MHRSAFCFLLPTAESTNSFVKLWRNPIMLFLPSQQTKSHLWKVEIVKRFQISRHAQKLIRLVNVYTSYDFLVESSFFDARCSLKFRKKDSIAPMPLFMCVFRKFSSQNDDEFLFILDSSTFPQNSTFEIAFQLNPLYAKAMSTRNQVKIRNRWHIEALTRGTNLFLIKIWTQVTDV